MGEAQAEKCQSCGRELTADEIAITKRLINRGTESFYCISCLAAWFEVNEQDIRDRIAYYRSIGCTLFEPKTE